MQSTIPSNSQMRYNNPHLDHLFLQFTAILRSSVEYDYARRIVQDVLGIGFSVSVTIADTADISSMVVLFTKSLDRADEIFKDGDDGVLKDNDFGILDDNNVQCFELIKEGLETINGYMDIDKSWLMSLSWVA